MHWPMTQPGEIIGQLSKAGQKIMVQSTPAQDVDWCAAHSVR